MGVPRQQIPLERNVVFYLGLFLILAGMALFVSAFFTTVPDYGVWFGMDAQQTSLGLHGLGGVLLAGLGGFLLIIGSRGWAERDSILEPSRVQMHLRSWSETGGGMPRDALAELDLPQTVRDRLDKEEPRLKVKCGKCQSLNHVGAKYCYACSARLLKVHANMNTRKHVHEDLLPADAARVFALLHTPSAIRGWWGAARAVVMPQEGSLWAAAWGEKEDDPDYITAALIQVFDPPRRLVLGDFNYYAKGGPLPFRAEITTEFTVEARPNGTVLRVDQDGFPTDTIADAFYAGCEAGWKNTFAGIRSYLNESGG